MKSEGSLPDNGNCPAGCFFVNKAFWNMVPKVLHDVGKGGDHAVRGEKGNGMTCGEGGSQFARSFQNRLPLKQACLPRGSQKRRPCQSRLLFLAFIVSQQNKPPAMPV